MKNKHFHEKPMLTIKHGSEYMDLYRCGCVGRPAIKMAPSGSWRIIGAVKRNNFGNAVGTYTLTEILKDPGSIEWTHKNGKQKVFIRDIDHGTIREWGHPDHCIF